MKDEQEDDAGHGRRDPVGPQQRRAVEAEAADLLVGQHRDHQAAHHRQRGDADGEDERVHDAVVVLAIGEQRREVVETHEDIAAAEVARAAALDLIGEEELRRVLRRLDEQGIRPILMKGVALANTLYKSPAFRPRGDTDLLIRESDLQPTLDILRELGYEGADTNTDKLISYECLYRRKNPFGPDHKLDVHWKINNAQLFANTFTFEELFAADGAGLDKLTDWIGLARTKGMKEEADKERVNASRGVQLLRERLDRPPRPVSAELLTL